jgi:glycyl-tRNA synthetase alpha chain
MPLAYQDLLFELQKYWSAQGCVIQQPYDLEVGAGTMCPETFLRVLGPDPYRVAYVQPSRRPNDGRYGENPNRLYKHMQLQVILKPAPADVQDLYLNSLEHIGVSLDKHDIKFEEDNWEAPTLGAWGVGWQVMLDGLEISQFTYFQQCGGLDLDPVTVELTYGLERLCAFIQDVDSVYDIQWNPAVRGAKVYSYRDIRWRDERDFSVYNFDQADVPSLWKLFEIHEAEAKRVTALADPPLLAAHEQVLKCSHLFNLLDARGAISVTERVGMIARVRDLAVGVAAKWVAPPAAEVQEVQS